MPHSDPDARRAYQRDYQRAYARVLRADPERRERFLAVKRTPRQRELENARRRVRYASDAAYRASAIGAVRTRKRAGAITEEAAQWARVLRRDPCAYCAAPATTVDHVDPWVKGGAGTADNLIGACGRCNSSKGSRPLLLFLLRRPV